LREPSHGSCLHKLRLLPSFRTCVVVYSFLAAAPYPCVPFLFVLLFDLGPATLFILSDSLSCLSSFPPRTVVPQVSYDCLSPLVLVPISIPLTGLKVQLFCVSPSPLPQIVRRFLNTKHEFFFFFAFAPSAIRLLNAPHYPPRGDFFSSTPNPHLYPSALSNTPCSLAAPRFPSNEATHFQSFDWSFPLSGFDLCLSFLYEVFLSTA